MKRFTTALKATTMAVAAVSLMATSAMATDGMYGNGTGARNKALAGSGVADQNDATAMSINPAGMVHSDNQLNVAASLFSPLREYEVTVPDGGGGFVNVGSDSDSKYFVIPNIAYTHRVDANTVFGLSMYGNGGMNTDYTTNFAQGSNPALNDNLGINLTQIFISAGLAKQYGNISVGVAPIVAVQIFTAVGTPNALGGVGSMADDIAAGIAIRGGVEWAVAPNFRVAVAGASPTYMQAFTSYDQPFELFGVDDGILNLPGTIQAGIAFDIMPTLTVMADYKRIFYGAEKVIGTATPVGFGWSDIDIYKFGVEWDVNPGLTLRAGYSYNDDPLDRGGRSFNANILAPAVSKHHFTGGGKVKVTETVDFEFAGMYTPEESVSTPGVAPGDPFFPAGAPPSTVRMHQWEATVGVVWHLGEQEAPLK